MLICGNRPSKMKLLCETEFEHNNEHYAAALEKGCLTKSILQPLGLTSPIRHRGSYGQI